MKCKYYGICGGCNLQHLSYEEQLKLKREKLKQLFSFEIPIIKNPKPFGYRSRMDFVYAFSKIGLRKCGSWREVVDIDKCLLMSKKANALLKRIREKVKELKLKGYDYIKHEGFIRYFVIRETKKEIMLNIVVARYGKSERERLIPLINSLLPYVDSLNILLNDSLSDVSFGVAVDSFKKDFIEEDYGIKLKVYPNCFLQSNREIALKLYKEIAKWCFGNCLDLYAGIGSIALFVAKKNKKIESVEGVEINEENINAFAENIELNRLKGKVKIYAGDVKKFLKETIKQNKSHDVVISDPPRAGMGKKICNMLLKLKPKRILLVSCKPETLKQDFEILKQDYKLIKPLAFDMFSQTKHIEVLFVLDRKQN